MKRSIIIKFIIVAIITWYIPLQSGAYSVLTHEAIIDVTWDKAIKPLLLKKFPFSTDAQLKDAQAYAYGGAIAPDMGYYPFGSKFFTDLIHYARTGDFIDALLDEAQDDNEYAFAIGVLSHYFADKYGHSIGINYCVSMLYPEDKEKFGSLVTYENDPVSHIRTEFEFDILQTARGNYASEKYHDFIGFKISQPLLERAFLKTYGLKITTVFNDLPLSIATFRWIIRDIFPTVTRAAWATKKNDILKANPGITRRKFEYKMHKANYYHEFGKEHQRPGFFPFVMGGIIKILPKIGALRYLKIKAPNHETEKLFIESFDAVQKNYTLILKELLNKEVRFQNIDYDTGNKTIAGEYALTDETYIELLINLYNDHFSNVNTSLKNNILSFYGGDNQKMADSAGAEKWNRLTLALDSLRVFQPAN
jgi:hypothetical protein